MDRKAGSDLYLNLFLYLFPDLYLEESTETSHLLKDIIIFGSEKLMNKANDLSKISLDCRIRERYSRTRVLNDAKLVFCTPCNSFRFVGNQRFDTLVIDEAANLKECESLIPLSIGGIKHVVLMGDDKQLQSVVKSPLNTQSERSSPARLKVYPQSESCGSSPASVSMELEYEIFPSVLMDLRRRILLSLHIIKFTKRDDQWRATDPSALTEVQRLLKTVNLNLSIDEIKEQVIAMEDDVKLDMAQVKRISEDRDSYFVVFNYVMPESVQETPPDEVLATAVMPTSTRKKMKMTCNPDCSTSNCRSDSSIGEHFSNLIENKEAVQELFGGKLSMENCTKKAESCGFDQDTLLEALDLLVANWEYRQIFMELNIKAAKAFILKKL